MLLYFSWLCHFFKVVHSCCTVEYVLKQLTLVWNAICIGQQLISAHWSDSIKVQISVWEFISSNIQSRILKRLIWNYTTSSHFSLGRTCVLCTSLCWVICTHEVKHFCNEPNPFFCTILGLTVNEAMQKFCFTCVLALFVYWNTLWISVLYLHFKQSAGHYFSH